MSHLMEDHVVDQGFDWESLRIALLATSHHIAEQRVLGDSSQVSSLSPIELDARDSLKEVGRLLYAHPNLLREWLLQRRSAAKVSRQFNRSIGELLGLGIGTFLASATVILLLRVVAASAQSIGDDDLGMLFGQRSSAELASLERGIYVITNMFTQGLLPAMLVLMIGSWIIVRIVLGRSVGQSLWMSVPLFGTNLRQSNVLGYLSIVQLMLRAQQPAETAYELAWRAMPQLYAREWTKKNSTIRLEGSSFGESMLGSPVFDDWLGKLAVSLESSQSEGTVAMYLSTLLQMEINLRSHLLIRWLRFFVLVLVLLLAASLIYCAVYVLMQLTQVSGLI